MGFQIIRTSRARLCKVLAASIALAGSAHVSAANNPGAADNPGTVDNPSAPDNTDAADGPCSAVDRGAPVDPGTATYHASVGPAIYATPTYPGGRGMRYIPFPFIDADYDNRFYTSASDVAGVYGYKTETTQAGAALEWDLTERHVRDLPNVNETPRFKLFASKTLEIVTGDVSVATDASGRGQGTLAQANLWLTVPFDPTFSVSFGPGLTWGDTDYTHTFFAVTNSEAAASDLPTFATHAGVADTHFNGLAEWVIFNHYRIGAAAYLAHLRGDAAISPITVRREQSTLTGWIAYRFK